MRTLLFSVLLSFPAVAQDAAPARPVVDDYTVTLRADGTPPARAPDVPRARWEHRGGGMLWTRVALSAVQTHGAELIETVPKDIAEWCPAYPDNAPPERAAFWGGPDFHPVAV